MKKTIIINLVLTILFLSGCVQDVPPATWSSKFDELGYVATHKDVLYIGDSNCIDRFVEPSQLSWVISGISGDCVSGRKLMDIEYLPDKRIIFLALGLNDSLYIAVEDYTIKLNQLLISTGAVVYCVLPILEDGFTGLDVDPFVNAMLSNCANTINPKDYGVLADYGDGSHWSALDMEKFTTAIIDRI